MQCNVLLYLFVSVKPRTSEGADSEHDPDMVSGIS